MKKMDISGLERLRKMNLKIGFAIALALILAAFSWTTERPAFKDPFKDLRTDDVLVIPPTVQEPAKEPPLPDPPETKVISDQVIVESDVPDLLSTELAPEEPALPNDNAVIGQPAPMPLTESPPPPDPVVEAPPIFKIVEEMPIFGDCNNEHFSKKEKKTCSERELLAYVYKNIRYPSIARENGVEGLVVVQFVVEEKGQISNATIVRDIGAGCGHEVLRVVNQMPIWIPGKQRGREVRVQYSLPVKFSLDK